MSVSSAKVVNFQSIAEAAVEFGRFTVLVGPSNSGKSAFLRAVRACLRNTAVPANVRQGSTKAEIEVAFDEATVAIERGKSLSTYRLGDATFTKSGRTVPPEIAAAIRLPLIEGIDATFAFQFDRPFLLAEPGSAAAAVIGSLTNVSTLHTAVREANRRRGEAAALLKVRQADALRYRTQALDFTGLTRRKAALDQVGDLLQTAQEAQNRLSALTAAVEVATTAQATLDRLSATQPPDLTPLLDRAADLVTRLRALTTATARLRRHADLLTRAAKDTDRARAAVEHLEAEHHTYLVNLGECPTCGARTATPLSA